MTDVTTMFEKIHFKDSNLRKHVEAPLLKEREEFLSHMEEKGLSLRYLQITSKYLLFAVYLRTAGISAALSFCREEVPYVSGDRRFDASYSRRQLGDRRLCAGSGQHQERRALYCADIE